MRETLINGTIDHPEAGTTTISVEQQINWPTPDSQLMNDGADPQKHAERLARLKATHNNGNGAGTPLGMSVKNWTTPQAHDVHLGSTERVGRFGTKAGGANLSDDVTKWKPE